MSTKRLYGNLASQSLLYLALGPPQLWFDPDGDALALAGRHSGWGYCWCQPVVTHRLAHGHVHSQVTHRRCADMSDAEFDSLGRPNTGHDVDLEGDVYPHGDHP